MAKPGSPGKWPLKWRETVTQVVLEAAAKTRAFSVVVAPKSLVQQQEMTAEIPFRLGDAA